MHRLALIPGALFVCAACASTSGIENEMSMMRRDFAAMKKELQETQLAVQRLEGQVTILSLDHREQDTQPVATREEKRAAPAKAAAQAKAAPSRTQPQSSHALPVVRLSQKAEAVKHGSEDPSWVDPGAQDDGSPPIMIQLGSDETPKERIAVDHEVLKHPDPVLGKPARAAEATSAEIESEYSAALGVLRGDKKPADAKAMFEAFKVKHPRSNLADNAMYWSAECDFEMKAYSAAIEGFQRLIHARPRSQKVPDAMIRIGESYAAMGDAANAKPVLEKVIASHPNSDAANRARAALDGLGTGGGN